MNSKAYDPAAIQLAAALFDTLHDKAVMLSVVDSQIAALRVLRSLRALHVEGMAQYTLLSEALNVCGGGDYFNHDPKAKAALWERHGFVNVDADTVYLR